MDWTAIWPEVWKFHVGVEALAVFFAPFVAFEWWQRRRDRAKH